MRSFTSEIAFGGHKNEAGPDSLRFGLAGCPSCEALISGCRISLRAGDIKFEDGFKVDNLEGTALYACDEKSCP
jgi:hypothetical protein